MSLMDLHGGISCMKVDFNVVGVFIGRSSQVVNLDTLTGSSCFCSPLLSCRESHSWSSSCFALLNLSSSSANMWSSTIGSHSPPSRSQCDMRQGIKLFSCIWFHQNAQTPSNDIDRNIVSGNSSNDLSPSNLHQCVAHLVLEPFNLSS